MNVRMENAVDIVKKWLNILNSGNIDLLIRASESNIAIVGSRGTAIGAEILREWHTHTHLTFDIEELLVNGSQVISLGMAHWYDNEGLEAGSAPYGLFDGGIALRPHRKAVST